jgi:type III secretion protein V
MKARRFDDEIRLIGGLVLSVAVAPLIAVCRAILTYAHGGHVIDRSGTAVARGGAAVGWLIVITIAITQVAVITATLRRVIDATARLTSAQAARHLGLFKFLRSDTAALIVIVLVNLLAVVVIGVEQHGLTALQALDADSVLLIGMAVTAQMSSILCATAAGLLVSRIADGGSTPDSAAA